MVQKSDRETKQRECPDQPWIAVNLAYDIGLNQTRKDRFGRIQCSLGTKINLDL
jgi:hypothetical protein